MALKEATRLTPEECLSRAEGVARHVSEGVAKLEEAESEVEALLAEIDPGGFTFARWDWGTHSQLRSLLLGFPGQGSDFSHPRSLVTEAKELVELIRAGQQETPCPQ